MTFDPVTLEVDGTLRNPAVLGSVVVWSLALTLVLVTALRLVKNRWTIVVLSLLLVVATPAAQKALVQLYYAARGFTGVGLWGHPPWWLAPLAAGVLTASVRTFQRRVSNAA